MAAFPRKRRILWSWVHYNALQSVKRRFSVRFFPAQLLQSSADHSTMGHSTIQNAPKCLALPVK